MPFEARPLSKVPQRDIPYIRQMIKERKRMLKEAQAEGSTIKAYEKQVKQIYIDGVFTKAGPKTIVFDPWKMLRKAQEDYMVKHPEYQSPWKKRGQRWKDFLDKAEVTIQKQQGLKK
jgi:hypothetical protein